MKCKAGIVGALLTLVGCGPTHQDVMTFLPAADFSTSGATYKLGPTDTIKIISPQAPEVNATVGIAANGTVHVKLLGEVRVAGLTAREIASKLRRELEAYYVEPEVHVSVARAQNRVFYLFGEVIGGRYGSIGGAGSGRSASSIPITGRDTILNVLTRNPPSSNAWLSQIKVIRPGRTPNENQEMRINFYNLIARGDMRQNVLLQEGDILYVPPTPMAWIGYRVRELLQPVAPAIAAYQTPAQIINADSVYDDLNGSSGASSGSRVLGSLTLP